MPAKWGRNPMTGKPVKVLTKAERAAEKAAAKQPAAKQPAAKRPAAKQPAAKQPAMEKPVATPSARAAEMAKGGRLRGGALADFAIAHRRAEDPTIEGLPLVTINRMKLGSRRLSPSLTHYLLGDRELFTLGKPQSFADLIESEFPEYAEWFADVGTKYLGGRCVLFEGWGSDSRRFLYLGAFDGHGEFPVFTIDTDDTPFICLNGPVDVWLAQQIGALEEEETYGHVPKAYEPARKELAKLCFGGYLAHFDGRFSKQLG